MKPTKTDARTIYLLDTIPFKDSYMTIELYESHTGTENKGAVEIYLTFPPKDGDHRICKQLRVKYE